MSFQNKADLVVTYLCYKKTVSYLVPAKPINFLKIILFGWVVLKHLKK